jgi:hypothetical protein
MVGIFLVIAFASNIALAGDSVAFTMVLAAQILFYVAALQGWRQRRGSQAKLFYIPFYFMMVNTASLVAMVRYFSGRRQSVWEKAESTRNGNVHDVPVEVAVAIPTPDDLVAAVDVTAEIEHVHVKAIKN